MAHTQNNIEALVGSQEAFEQLVQQRLRQAVRVALISVLEEEVSAVIGALPYERNQQRRDQRNGHYTRDLDTSIGRIEDLPVPRTRGAITRSCLNAIIVGATNWTRPLQRCLWMG